MADAIDPRWAWEPYRPSASSPWDLRKVGHLYRRAAFGATWAELQVGLQAGPEKAVADLLQGDPGRPEFDADRKFVTNHIVRFNNGNLAGAWWLMRVLHSPHPLREKMTLFWHNHFATSNRKVQNAGYMIGQYELMYRHALGSFRTLLQEMSKDPAMMVWLDTAGSKKGNPNENYARELMELFSLGIGNYTETDIREAARAFTGWEIKDGKAVFNPAQHDAGTKTVLGRTGPFKGEDIVNICLEQKCCPVFLAGKLFRFLISETMPPTPELLEPLAEQLRQSDFDIGGLVATMLRSNLFFSPQVYRSRIKGPVDFALGIIRGLEGHIPDERGRGFGPATLSTVLEELGQSVFYPPSVKGWDGGPAWLNGQTLLTRQNLALTLCSHEVRYQGRLRPLPAVLAERHGKKSDTELVDFFLTLFLQGEVPAASRARLLEYQRKSHQQPMPVYWTAEEAADRRVRSLCHLVLTLPEFQLD
ncbi:MAG TPA: DUF1800 domain-containing protein [Gemmataceae bacterium]|nr:DUF1800 domain-containing protein [Gemmataceae bacterium]